MSLPSFTFIHKGQIFFPFSLLNSFLIRTPIFRHIIPLHMHLNVQFFYQVNPLQRSIDVCIIYCGM
jgi:hypothetical protein